MPNVVPRIMGNRFPNPVVIANRVPNARQAGVLNKKNPNSFSLADLKQMFQARDTYTVMQKPRETMKPGRCYFYLGLWVH